MKIMKKITLLLFLSFCLMNVFGQKSNSPKNTYIAIYRFDNQTYYDSIYVGEEVVIPLKRIELRDKILGFYKNDGTTNNGQPWTIDKITENATININGIRFENKNILSRMAGYEIHRFRTDSLYSFKKNEKTGEQSASVRYLRPHAFVSQNHQNLPSDFFFFKASTLEPMRYRCSSYSPIFDVFNTEDSVTAFSKPRVIIDGRMQTKVFDYQNINFQNVIKVEVFDKEDARKYFGQKAKSGLISLTTNESNFNLDWALSNIRIVGEIQDLKGNWSMVSDTVLSNIEQFKNYRRVCLEKSGTVYLINGKFETENVNRKTINLEFVKSIRIVENKKKIKSSLNPNNRLNTEDHVYPKDLRFEEIGSDTVFIEMGVSNNFVGNHESLSSIMKQIDQIKNPKLVSYPIYIVDNQEIDSEKLKQYKPKELEFVESLEGCDAISKYGKRAEFGVVIYRKRE